MMKILQVNKMYSPDIGGVETVCQQYSEYYADEHDVTVLCVHGNFKLLGKTSVINNIKVIRCSSIGTFFSMPVSLTFLFNFFVQYVRCDVVFFHLPFPLSDLALLLCGFIKKRVVLVWHSDIVKQGRLKKFLSPVLRNSIARADKIIVTSPRILDYSKDLINSKYKCSIIPLSINCKKIRSYVCGTCTVFREFDWFDEDKPIDGLFLGRLCYYKGVDVLLDMLLKIKEKNINARVVIAGSGVYEAKLKDFIVRNEIKNIFFINRFVTDEEKYWLIKKSKCFLFPSVEVAEAFGITQLESMCLGVPVINTDIKSGVPWVSLHNVTGLTVSPKDSDQLYSAFLEILSDSVLREMFSLNSMERVDNVFDDKVIFKALDSVLE